MNRNRRPFKSVSYMIESKQGSNQDVLRHYQKLIRLHSAGIQSIKEEKAHIRSSQTRELMHITEKNREAEAYQENIRNILEFLRSSSKNKVRPASPPPTLRQMKRVSDAICREGLRFKAMSNEIDKVETELAGLNTNERSLLGYAVGDNNNFEHDLAYFKDRLAHNVFCQEEAMLKRETVQSNRDMLVKMIFDYKTALETVHIQKQALQCESERLADDFHDALDIASRTLGTIAWRTAIVKASDEVASMGVVV
jgi:hypothetical protein